MPRTSTETVHIVDPEVDTTLTSSDGSLIVTLSANARDEFFQVAIDALSNSCGTQAPVGERQMCVLVDLFDLAAESVQENMDRPATMSIILDSQQYSAVQTDIDNGDFTLWKGHGPTDISWDEIPQCENPRGTSECYSLVSETNGGKITVYNITSFSQFTGGIPASVQPPSEPPPTSPPSQNSGSSGSGNSGRGHSGAKYEYIGNQAPRISGLAEVDYEENGTGPVAEYTAKDPEGDDFTWSLFGIDRKLFELSDDGVLSFISPPDYESPDGLRGNTYWVMLQAEDDGSPRQHGVKNVYVTVTQVNELGAITGDAELSVPEGQAGAVAQYQVDDPERGVVEWSLSGADASGFKIDENGSLSPTGKLDFEAPGSSDGTNVHALTINVADDGQPELTAHIDVTLTVTNVNEAPLATEIPGVDMTTMRQMPWILDLGEYFTDPDGDSLSYETSSLVNNDVVKVEFEGDVMSITPVAEGAVTIEVVAVDSGGLRAASRVSVSVTEPLSAATPAPAVVVDITPPAPETVPAIAPETPPAYESLWPLSERRISNQTQPSDMHSKFVATFRIEPVPEPITEHNLPPMATQAPTHSETPADEVTEALGQMPLSAALEEAGWLTIWLLLLFILLTLITAGYSVRMYVIHRL